DQINIETYDLQLLAVRLQIVAIIILAALAVMILWIALQASRQSKAIANTFRVFEDWSMMITKERREAMKGSIDIADPMQWFSQLSGVEVIKVIRKFDNPMALDLGTADNARLVVSPLKPSDLKSALGSSRRSSVLGLFKKDKRLEVTPLLGNWEFRVKSFDRTANNAGEFFDLEAAEIGNRLGVNWGETNRLWFYVVPGK
ncbi:MAG: hypothetical protein RBT34_09990, partial [Anaerolineaceae bacterium]|nr:hypothetical protein [Anaerolineaceae bacterium]